MLTIYNHQLAKMAAPLREKLLRTCLATLEGEYPEAFAGRSEEELLETARALFAERRKLRLKADESVVSYIVMCLRHGTGYERLRLHQEIGALLQRTDLNEAERLYLTDNILSKS